MALGELPSAVGSLQRVLELDTRLVGAAAPATLTTKTSLASAHLAMGALAAAAVLLSDVIAVETAARGQSTPLALNAKRLLATVLLGQGKGAEAAALSADVRLRDTATSEAVEAPLFGDDVELPEDLRDATLAVE
eukprot:c4969_g1_i1.p2 GENE.c4969_g1_i1~~c4969_g1_i1.p2  ORF type:complete len:135 (-),score=22.60 c4969_g1_i1:5-409(-)